MRISTLIPYFKLLNDYNLEYDIVLAKMHEKCIRNFSHETLREETTLKT
jgi:hypothetical protein